VPSGACLPGGHAGNPYASVPVRYTCDGHHDPELVSWAGEKGWWAPPAEEEENGGKGQKRLRRLRM